MNSEIFILSGIIAVYLGVIAVLSLIAWKRSKSSSDYLLAGRKAHPFVMAMSYGAAFISTSAIIGFGGMAAKFGLGLLWLPFMNIAVGILLAFLFFGKRTRQIGNALGASTFPEFLGLRFGSKNISRFVALVIFLVMPLYASAVLSGGARVLESFMDYDIALIAFAVIIAVYVSIGGMKGVMYVDSFMGAIMLCGMCALLVMTYKELGGFISVHEKLSSMAHLVPADLAAKGHQGWTAMPELNSECWWLLVSSLILGVGIGALAQPQLAVRFMTVSSGKQLNRAILVGSIFILMTAGFAYVIGALSNVWYFEQHGRIAVDMANGNADAVMPMFIKDAMAPWFYYIFTVTLLSAGMSTLSSLLHVIGSSFGNDLLACTKYSKVKLTRVGIIIGIVAAVVIAWLLPGSIIARVTAMFFGVCAAAFLPAYFAALYSERVTKTGLWASIISGTAVCIFATLFMHRAESAPLGICRMIFGKTELFGVDPWPYIDPLVFALPISIIMLIAGSFFGKPCKLPCNITQKGSDNE